MVKYGVTETGFVKKTYSNLIDDLHVNAKKMFGSTVDLTPGSPIKIMIDMFAAELLGLWNELEACYRAGFLNTATGYSLNSLGQLVGAERDPGIYATGEITFCRTTPLPLGSPRIIPAGTKVSTAMIRPTEYVTTQSVYFQPTIINEEHIIYEASHTIDTVNLIYSISNIEGSNGTNYTASATFSGRKITFEPLIPAGVTISVTYRPLSVTAPIRAIENGADSNVPVNTITILNTPVDFIHYISNENGIDSGADVESDSHFRAKIVGATQSVGKATNNALMYYLSKVPDVKNVIIEDPLRETTVNTITGNGTTSFFVTKTPVYSINTVTGTVGGTYQVNDFNMQTGEVTLNIPTTQGEDVTVYYTYVVPGKIRVYVEGGEVGDEFTENTIVYVLENTRAAGVQSVGYNTNDPTACGSPSAQFSWFYRPKKALIDITATIYFNPSSVLTDSAKGLVITGIQDCITDYVNELTLNDKIYKTKLLQIMMGVDPDIFDIQITDWRVNGLSKPLTDAYIQAADMEIMIAQNITLTKAVA